MTQHHLGGTLLIPARSLKVPLQRGRGVSRRRSLRGLGRTVVSVVASIPTVEAQVQLATSLFLFLRQAHAGAPHGLGRVCLVVVIVDLRRHQRTWRGSRLAGSGRPGQPSLNVDALADQRRQRLGHFEARQLRLDVVAEALVVLVDQGGLVPIQVLRDHLESVRVVDHRPHSLAQTSDLAFGGLAPLGVFKDVLHFGHEGWVVVHQVVRTLQFGRGPAGGAARHHAGHEADTHAIDREIAGALLHKELALGHEGNQHVWVAVELLGKVFWALLLDRGGWGGSGGCTAQLNVVLFLLGGGLHLLAEGGVLLSEFLHLVVQVVVLLGLLHDPLSEVVDLFREILPPAFSQVGVVLAPLAVAGGMGGGGRIVGGRRRRRWWAVGPQGDGWGGRRPPRRSSFTPVGMEACVLASASTFSPSGFQKLSVSVSEDKSINSTHTFKAPQ